MGKTKLNGVLQKMNIYVKYSDERVITAGKAKFLKRLAAQLFSLGYNITNQESQRVDVALHNIKINKKIKSQINILRLDGICFDSKLNYKNKNLRMQQNLKLADGVVYQSQWAESMCDKYLGKFDGPTAVIFNGADPEFYNETKALELPYDHLFFTSSRWRAFKRLTDTIESFIFANIPNSALYVAGDIEKSAINEKLYANWGNVNFLGTLNDEEIAFCLKRADAFLHLSRFDACPNGVVEAIASGTNVICGNISGTREVVELSGGIVCDIEEPYNMEPVDVYNVPPIDKSVVIQALWNSINYQTEIYNDHVNIRNVADQYYQFFKLCMENRK